MEATSSSEAVVLLARGSFDPPTYTHMRMFERAKDHLERQLHRVLEGVVSPSGDTTSSTKTLAKHRLRMVETAVRRSYWIRSGDFECFQRGRANLSEVVKHYEKETSRKFGCAVKIFILVDLDEFRRLDDVERNAYSFITIRKDSVDVDRLVVVQDSTFPDDMGSEKIRQLIKRGESVKYCLDDDVIEYIQDHDLYKERKNPTEQENPFLFQISQQPAPVPPTRSSSEGRAEARKEVELSICQIETPPSSSLSTPKDAHEEKKEKFEPDYAIVRKDIKINKRRTILSEPELALPLPAPLLSPTYDNVTLDDLLEASTSWAEYMSREKRKNHGQFVDLMSKSVDLGQSSADKRNGRRLKNGKKSDSSTISICASDRRLQRESSTELVYNKLAEKAEKDRRGLPGIVSCCTVTNGSPDVARRNFDRTLLRRDLPIGTPDLPARRIAHHSYKQGRSTENIYQHPKHAPPCCSPVPEEDRVTLRFKKYTLTSAPETTV